MLLLPKGHRSFECPRKAASVEHKKRKKEEFESQALDRAVPRETPSAPVSSKPMVGATVELPPPVTDSISPPVDDEVTPPTDQSLSDEGSEEDSSEYDPMEDPQASIDTEEKVSEEQTVEEDIEITEVEDLLEDQTKSLAVLTQDNPLYYDAHMPDQATHHIGDPTSMRRLMESPSITTRRQSTMIVLGDPGESHASGNYQ